MQPESTRRFVLDQRGGNVALDLFVVDQHLGSLVDATLAEAGITGNLYAVYSQLAQGPRTPGQLSETLGVRPTTLSGYLATMAGSGARVQVQEPARRSFVGARPDRGRPRQGPGMPTVMQRALKT